MSLMICSVFFFKQKTAYEMRISDWSSDVCSSDLMAMGVLGGLSSSRLDNAMVRKDPVAVSVAAYAQPFEDAGILIVQADVKEGVDPDLVGKRLDEEIAKFLATGPTADELQRTAASTLGGTIAGLESVGGFRSEEHTSELQSLIRISYAVFCLKKKK